MKKLTRGLKWLYRADTSTSAVAYTLLGRVAILGMNVSTGIIMARLLGPAGRGSASAISLWPVLLAGVLTLGIPVSLRYNLRRRKDEPRELLSVALLMGAILGTTAAVLGAACMPRLLSQYPPAVIQFAQVMMLFTPFMSINALLQGFLDSQGRFAQSSGMVYLPPAGTLGALIVLYFLHKITIFSVPLAYEAPFACVTIITALRLRQSIVLPTQIFERAKLLLHFGIRAYGLDVLNTLSAQIGQVIVIGLLTATSFGLYTVALSASRVLAIVASSLNTILFPKASELEPDEAVALVSRSARLVFASNVAIGLLMIPIYPFLIRVAYGSAYLPIVSLVRLLTCEVVIYATVGTLSQAFMATGRPGLVTVFQCIGLCTAFPLMLVLIPRFGLNGAAYSLLASTMLRLSLVLISYPIFLHKRIPRLILTNQDLRDIRMRLVRAAA